MFLIDRFQQFHSEVTRLVTLVSHGSWVFEGPGTVGASDAGDAAPTAVWRRLLTILERQALDAGREGGDFALELYRRAQFAMAALADEVFLNLDWPGREKWREDLLEAKLFGTRRAGEEVFERIEEILRDRDTVYTELARVYLMVLALGFQGKYRGEKDAEQEIAAVRRRLFRFVFNREPQVVRGNERIVPQAYASTRDERRSVELPYLKPWIAGMVLVIVLWVAAAHALWLAEVSQLEPLVNEIVQRAQSLAPGERL